MSAIWNYDWTGKSLLITQRRVKIDEQLSEVLDDRLGLRHILTRAHDTNTGERLMLTIQYELNPDEFDFENPEEIKEMAKLHWLHGVDTVDIVGSLGHGPKYHAHTRQTQGCGMPYRGGRIYFIIMGDVPGEDVDELLDELSVTQLASIRKQLAFILE
ncbi:uncharacterized protein ASPGLDRAFT_36724 [Aspergillus glaucus CBS 516.65]|uniref:Uncharacterized protein n=1 Tax=Aspergillus glaucus CBS 516.65 TaxID=1160497 RepID=A0A1L9VFJ0_ASPGL|nr:hypothetical protein ASPGLDRAFT_36724 [Aspergillus glaucus CBS 516.65]OJJ82592.1 hypothetical protein ASPGLDRAFT_36724 [Aspergillus glaucus CBS 516.65]